MSTVPLLDARLGREDLARLHVDLAALTQILDARVEDGRGTRRCRLGEAFRALEARSAQRVQIRYRYEGLDWCDTLLCAPDAVRLVRLCEEDAVLMDLD